MHQDVTLALARAALHLQRGEVEPAWQVGLRVERKMHASAFGRVVAADFDIAIIAAGPSYA